MKDSTRIVIVLDRSGSMESARESTVKGLNTFVSEQKKNTYDITLKLAQFDDNLGELSYEIIHDAPIKSIPEFTQKDFVPRGSTPLLDAQGKAITELGEELAALPEYKRPNKVIFVTITDGYENASKNYTREKIKKLIDHQTTKYNWDFVYLGANQDAVAVGKSMGYLQGKSMSYNISDPITVGATFRNLSAYATRSGSVSDPARMFDNYFEEEERSTSVGK